jgi:cell division protein FtsB
MAPPFGMMMQERSFTSNTNENKFSFNGKENDNEIYGQGNSYTTLYWQYDSRLGRRWNVDPRGRNWESSYGTLGNNPSFNVDFNGDKWDPSNNSKAIAQKHKKHVNEKIISNNDQIENNKEKIQSLNSKLEELVLIKSISEPTDMLSEDGSDISLEIEKIQSAVASLESQNNELSASNKLLNSHIETINSLGESEVIYSLIPTSGQPKTLAPSSTVVQVFFDGTHENLGHELTHAGQYERGREALPRAANTFSPTWDINDEVEAFKVEQALDQSLFGKLSNVTPNSIVNKYPVYSSASIQNLTVNSGLGQVAHSYKRQMFNSFKSHGNISLKSYYNVYGDVRFSVKPSK